MSDGGGHFVSVDGVTKRFDELVVLRNIHLNVDLHHVVCLIGASGSGKSTLLRCINLLEQVDEGSISVDGQTITNGEVDVNELRRTMLERHARYVPVMDGTTLLGVVSFHDVAKAVLEEQGFENQMLKSYIQDSPA